MQGGDKGNSQLAHQARLARSPEKSHIRTLLRTFRDGWFWENGC
jgi:hypothetical protein